MACRYMRLHTEKTDLLLCTCGANSQEPIQILYPYLSQYSPCLRICHLVYNGPETLVRIN